MKLRCISCNKEINEAGSVNFKCPSCSEFHIVRCRHCREIAAKYVCQKCGFNGPN